jgi:hypothetical protein
MWGRRGDVPVRRAAIVGQVASVSGEQGEGVARLDLARDDLAAPDFLDGEGFFLARRVRAHRQIVALLLPAGIEQ